MLLVLPITTSAGSGYAGSVFYTFHYTKVLRSKYLILDCVVACPAVAVAVPKGLAPAVAVVVPKGLAAFLAFASCFAALAGSLPPGCLQIPAAQKAAVLPSRCQPVSYS